VSSQVTEKVANGQKPIPQRLKPNSICSTYGTTKVMP
jgi:hypothetical protein